MSDHASAGRGAIGWRGPLLAAAIFACISAVLLLMAGQNQSNTDDQGSSLRQDPSGTSLLFDSYQRAGYQVDRSEDEESLADQDASRTTAFFIGGHPYEDAETGDEQKQAGAKFRGRLEDFLARGGRVVLIEPARDLTLKSSSQDWAVETEPNQTPDEAGSEWAAADVRAMPPGSEMIYLAAGAHSLKTDAKWAVLYAGAAKAHSGPENDKNAGVGTSAPAYLAMRSAGKGDLLVASQQSFLLNEVIKTHPSPVLLDFLDSGRPVIWVDETLHGLRQDEGLLWLVQRYRLQSALLLFWATLLALLWSMSGDLVRRPARDWSAAVIQLGEGAGVAGQHLLQRSVPAEQVAAECWDQFRHRSPHDAQTISADPHWGPRLRAALASAPLEGYRKLSSLIAERRASAKGMNPAGRGALSTSAVAPKNNPEEVRIA